MNRRGFLGSISAFAAACVLDPEIAVWKPGAKMISLPAKVVLPPKLITLEIGDVFTIAGRYAVNPITRRIITFKDVNTGKELKSLQKFVATRAHTSSENNSNNTFPAGITSGQFQNLIIDPYEKAIVRKYAPQTAIVEIGK